MVVIADRLDCSLCASVPLGQLVEVRVLDTNLFDDLSSLIRYYHLCVPFIDINSEVQDLFIRDASA